MSGIFAVSSSGSSVQEAAGPQQLLSMNNPFTKLDTTNVVSFQTIQLLFNHEPPQAPASPPYNTQTLVYQFPHGYNYVPAVWLSWQNNSPAFPGSPPDGGSNMILYPNGDESEGGTTIALEQYNNSGSVSYASEADLLVTVDDTNVNIYVNKTTLEIVDGAIVPIYIIGVILNLRVYCFTEPGTTSTY